MASSQDFSKTSKIEKAVIDYARFARILKFNKKYFFLQLVLFLLIFETPVFLFSEEFFQKIAHFAKKIYGGEIHSYKFLWMHFDYFVTYGRLPTVNESIIYFIISLVFLIFLFSRFNPIVKPVSAWLLYISFVYATSSAFFIFFPERFPYTMEDFGVIYVILNFGIFLLIPILLGISLSLFSFSVKVVILNFFILLITMIYAGLLGSIRYIASIYVLKEFSYIHMAPIFFVFGPLLDFIYISSFYAIAMYTISKLYISRGRGPYTWIWEQ